MTHRQSQRAGLEVRAIILHFEPSKAEIHRWVGQWFQDHEVYHFIARIMPSIKTLSMRHYRKGSQLRRAGLIHWRKSLLQVVLPDQRLAWFLSLQYEPALNSEHEKIKWSPKQPGAPEPHIFA
jgi:hypothetical protein